MPAMGVPSMSSALQTKAKAPEERLTPNSYYLLPPCPFPYSNLALRWFHAKDSICGKRSMLVCPHVHAEEFGADAFVLGTRPTHKQEKQST